MKNIFITGATSGIGLVVACELAAHGNKVIATARTLEKGKELTAHYKTLYPKGIGTIEIILCDLSSFECIVNACNQVKTHHTHIDVLINNAGIWNFSYRESKDKIEETLQVNVLAPLLINYLLLDLLIKSKDAKSIFAASALHQGNVDFENLEFKYDFGGFKAYRQSKLEVILICRLLAKKLQPVNIGVYCEHPGFVNTKLGRDANWLSNLFFRVMGMPPEKGARTIMYLAEEDKSKLVSGEYYSQQKVKKITPQSNDMQVAKKLINALKIYLKNYVLSPSLIFVTENKNT
jgi:NAD(P)-dependent dehydrogenase (short-subunit alcohol dehydrogenase family)